MSRGAGTAGVDRVGEVFLRLRPVEIVVRAGIDHDVRSRRVDETRKAVRIAQVGFGR
jgi:hypothetical protein